MSKPPVRIINERYYNELVTHGNTVPRYMDSGEVIPFTVGGTFTIKHKKDMDGVLARCTQSSPHNLRLIEDESL